MIIMGSILDVADNSGAKRASMIGVIGRSGKRSAEIGDVITCNIKESTPTAEVKKGTVARAVVVRTAYPISRGDGSILKFDNNAVVIIDKDGNPKGTRVFGPVARELRKKKFMKIVSLAPEVI
ncbi:MAG: 50S ribosomal protein L14 [Candidatus Omnitrophica bacterium]|nr:50S ribosomal protein L14 [Candidatus Omnitrophota bacterium]